MASLDTDQSDAAEEMRAAIAEGDLTRAAERFQRASERDPHSEDLALEYAEGLIGRGEFRAAAVVVTEALGHHPDSFRLLCQRGWIEFHQKRWKPAAKAFAAALQLEPGDEDALLGRAGALESLGRLDEARAALDVALQANPDSTDLHRIVGRFETEHQHWEAALEAFGKLDAADVEGVLGQANALLSLGRHAEAQTLLEAAVRAAPTSPFLRTGLGKVQYLRWRPDRAAVTLARAVELGADDTTTALWRARALRELNRCEEALAVIDAARASDEQDVDLHLEAGEIALAMHDYGAAERAYRRVLEQNKKDARGKKGVKRARRRTGRWRALARPTRAWDRATRRFYAASKPALALIAEMPRLDEPARIAVHAAVSRFAWRRARVNGTAAITGGAFGAVWMVALVVIAVATPFVLKRQGAAGGATAFEFVYIYACSLAGGWFLAALVLAVVPVGKASTYAGMALTVLYGALAVVAASEAESLGPTAASVIVWSLTANAIVVALMLGLTTLLVVGEGARLRYVDRRDAHTACLHALADLLVRLRDGIVLTNRAQVRSATDTLERAATLLRAHLKGEPTGDLRTDAWLAKRADGHAQALRECKQALLSPGVGSVESLRRRLSDDFVHIARGHWRNVPWTDPAPATARTRRLRARTIARTLLVALAPLAIVLVISGQDWIGLGQDAADKLKLITLGWAFLSILMALDPGFNDKFAALRGGAELLKPGGGGGQKS
jgi:tetratricopeptide (TPR) repeat protein